jgi:hypothetical protein
MEARSLAGRRTGFRGPAFAPVALAKSSRSTKSTVSMSSRHSADKTADKEGAGAVGETCKCFILYGERGRNRTYNLLIKRRFTGARWGVVHIIFNSLRNRPSPHKPCFSPKKGGPKGGTNYPGEPLLNVSADIKHSL